MLSQALVSVMVGLGISSVLFFPILIWHYRRYGRPDITRLFWTVAGFIYVSALIAFTIFPIPDFDQGYCATHATEPVYNILRVPAEAYELFQKHGLAHLFEAWLFWETALNILLFVPLGFLVRRVFEYPRLSVLAVALGTSIFIEATQITGNWGIAECPYRVADITDLVTNTSGAALGIALEALVPRFLQKREELRRTRHQPRAVTRRRRLLGMILDTGYLIVGFLSMGAVTGMALSLLWPDYFSSPLYGTRLGGIPLRLEFMFPLAATMCMVIIPAASGTGASLGQRTVYLRPATVGSIRRGAPGSTHNGTPSRLRLILRSLCVQGLLLTSLLTSSFIVFFCAAFACFASAICVLFTTRGFSGLVTRCAFVDSRAASDDSQQSPRDSQAT